MNKKLRNFIDNMPLFENEDDAKDYFLSAIEKKNIEISDEELDELMNEVSKDFESLSKEIKEFKKNQKKKK